MSTTAIPPHGSVAGRWLAIRAGLLFGLAAAEVLAFSLIFDVQQLALGGPLLGRPIGYGAPVFRVLLVAAAAWLGLAWNRLPGLAQDWRNLASQDRTWSWSLAAHFVLASLFAIVSARMLLPYEPSATNWQLVAWLFVGGLAVGAWLLALAPIRFWNDWLRDQHPLELLASLSIALMANFSGLFTRELWIPLSDLTLALCHWLLSLVRSDVVIDSAERILGTSNFTVRIAPKCSGYEGIGLSIVTLAIVLIVFRERLRFPRALLLVPLGVAAIWLLNAVRIVALILVGAYLSPTVAVDGFHSQAGWIMFVALTLSIAAGALRSPWFRRSRSEEVATEASGTASDTAAYLMPLLAMIATGMIVALFSTGFDRLYPLKIVAALGVWWHYRRSLSETTWSWSWTAVAIGGGVFALWLATVPAAPIESLLFSLGLSQMTWGSRTIWLFARVLGSVLVVPMVEELAFRGYLLRRFAGRDFTRVEYDQVSWLAVAGSSLVYGLVTGHWLVGTLAGVGYALAARARNRLSDAIVAHAVTNALIALVVLTMDSWNLWE